MDPGKIRAYLELGRVANLPTVLSNSTVGFILGGGQPMENPLKWALAALTSMCLYEGGMVLNDYCDFSIDLLERPERPLPSDRVSKTQALVIASTFFSIGILGVLLTFPRGTLFAIILLLMIVVYNKYHAASDYSPILMGCCRGFIYLLSASAGGYKNGLKSPLLMAIALTFYVSGISFVARSEMSQEDKKGILRIDQMGFLLIFVALGFPGNLPGTGYFIFILVFAVTLGWILQNGIQVLKKKKKKAIGHMLASLSLFDALIFSKIDNSLGIGISLLCFFGAYFWQRQVRCT